jgi:diaminopimelate decarboxylase
MIAEALLPESAAVERGELTVGGIGAAELAERFGTPLLVYCEDTLLADVRAYREAAPGALVLYGVKAFPNVALLELLGAQGLGADVSTLGELAFARHAGIPGERIVVHGNNKSERELEAAAEAGARFVVLDALDEVQRAAAAGVPRALVRVTPGIEANTHPAIRTAHHGSKFGLPPDQVPAVLAEAREAGIELAGLHLHIGSQLVDLRAPQSSVEWLGGFAARCRAELGWEPSVIDLGGGLGIRYLEGDRPPGIAEFVGALLATLGQAWKLNGLTMPQAIFEPGRSLVGRAGLTLYRVGVVKQAATTTYVAVDGGMSDNPRPQLYNARYGALLASRAGEQPTGSYAVCGKHCESGDVLIESVELPEPRRGDLLAVPATGAYTLAMGSNYNAVPRPAAVLVRDGEARVIRRRESLDDLLRLEQASR